MVNDQAPEPVNVSGMSSGESVSELTEEGAIARDSEGEDSEAAEVSAVVGTEANESVAVESERAPSPDVGPTTSSNADATATNVDDDVEGDANDTSERIAGGTPVGDEVTDAEVDGDAKDESSERDATVEAHAVDGADAVGELPPPETSFELEEEEDEAYVYEDASSAPTDSVKGDDIEGFDDDFRALGLEKDEPAYLGEMDVEVDRDLYETRATGADVAEEEASLKLARLSAAIEEAEEEAERLTSENTRHQLGLMSIFNARKTTATSSIPEQKKITDSSSSTRYLQSLAQWITLVEDRERIASAQDALEFESSQSLNDKQMRADDVCRSYNEFVREVARQSEYSRTGKLLPAKLVDAMVSQEERKDEEVRHVRLRNIQLRTQVRKLDWRLKAKEELAEGLHLIDFEQLKIENQSLNEKIEERNEELLKLRKKTTSTVQVVTHLKEKLQFVHKENSVLEETLKKLEARLSSQRDRTQFVKHELTALKSKNRQFKRQSEVVTSRALLRDVETQKKKKDELLSSINTMKTLYMDKTSSRVSTSHIA